MMIRGVLLQPVIVALLLSLLYMDRSEAVTYRNKLYRIEYKTGTDEPTGEFCKYSEDQMFGWATMYLHYKSGDKLKCLVTSSTAGMIDKLTITGPVVMMNTTHVDKPPLEDGILVADGTTRTLLQKIIVPKSTNFPTGEYALSSRHSDEFVEIKPHPGFQFWSDKLPAGGLYCPFVLKDGVSHHRIQLWISTSPFTSKKTKTCRANVAGLPFLGKELCVRKKYIKGSKVKIWDKKLGPPSAREPHYVDARTPRLKDYSCTEFSLGEEGSTDH